MFLNDKHILSCYVTSVYKVSVMSIKGLDVFTATVYFVLLGAAGCVLLLEKSCMGLWAPCSGD